jgi:hypothetical protein
MNKLPDCGDFAQPCYYYFYVALSCLSETLYTEGYLLSFDMCNLVIW